MTQPQPQPQPQQPQGRENISSNNDDLALIARMEAAITPRMATFILANPSRSYVLTAHLLKEWQAPVSPRNIMLLRECLDRVVKYDGAILATEREEFYSRLNNVRSLIASLPPGELMHFRMHKECFIDWIFKQVNEPAIPEAEFDVYTYCLADVCAVRLP